MLAVSSVTSVGSGSDMAIDDDQSSGNLETDPVRANDMELEFDPDEIMEDVNGNDVQRLNYSFLDDSDREMLLNSPPAYEEFTENNDLGLCTKMIFFEIFPMFSCFSFHGLESQ